MDVKLFFSWGGGVYPLWNKNIKKITSRLYNLEIRKILKKKLNGTLQNYKVEVVPITFN